MARAVYGEVQVSFFVAGAVFGEVELSLFVAGTVYGEGQVPFFVAGAVSIRNGVKSNLGCEAGCGLTVFHARIMVGSFSERSRMGRAL